MCVNAQTPVSARTMIPSHDSLHPQPESEQELKMYSNGFGWGWFVWIGFMIIMFSSVGNWGYTYRVHRFSGRPRHKDALDILDERYARGEITLTEFRDMKAEISRTTVQP